MGVSAATDGKQKVFDVAIIGSGIGGTMLAAILARHHLRVILIEESVHPRFAVGESIVPETAAMFRVVAARHGVPEIANLSSAYNIRRHITSNCGVKRAFSFVYQRDGQCPDPMEINQLPTLSPPLGPDTHMFRQDIDAYMLSVAVQYGSEIIQKTKILKLEREEPGYRIETSRGVNILCRFVVDAAGDNSPVAAMHKLREDPSRLRTDSRAIFTHMVSVRPYDECGPPRREHRMPVAFHQSTLHHVFDGGWLWVIPFDNCRNSTNLLCSVGLVFDRRKSPKAEAPAEEEFRNFVSRYPTLETQFQHARSVREWTSTGRLQYSSRKLVEDRCLLLGHAGGFIDPLFSSGLGMTINAVNAAADALISAVAENDFSLERFAACETWGQRNLDHYDCVVGRAFDSFANFTLWNAWFRVWVLSNFLGALGPIFRHFKYQETGDRKYLDALRSAPFRGMGACDLDEFAEFLAKASGHVEGVGTGNYTPEQGASLIISMLRDTKLAPPQLHLGNPDIRSTSTFTLFRSLGLYFWGKLRAPRRLRELHYDTRTPAPLVMSAARAVMAEITLNIRTTCHFIRDMLFAWNRDWQRRNPAGAEVNGAEPARVSRLIRPTEKDRIASS